MLSCLNRKITPNKSPHLLVRNELNELKTFNSSYFFGKSHFDEDGTQNYLIFQAINKHFKIITNTDYVSSWKSKRLSSFHFHVLALVKINVCSRYELFCTY